MRKVLLGTTALVAASFVASAAMADEMMAEPISASVGGHYFVALGGVSGDDGVGEPRANKHSTLMAQDLQLVFSGSTTLDNGMTVSLRAAMDSDHGDTGNAHWDERSVTLGGAFGRLQLGSVESARQQTTTFAPNAAGMMGINTPYFTFAGALVRYNDGIGAEDALKLIYFTPSMNGFSVGVSYAPEDSGGSQYGGASDDDGAYKNHVGVGATFSQDFAGGSVGISAGYETYDAEVPNGMSCSSPTPMTTGDYTLTEKRNALLEAADAMGNDDGMFDDGEEADAVALANIAWQGDDDANPLIDPDDATGLVDIAVDNGARVYNFAMPGTGGDPIVSNCEPETIQFGLSLSFGDFSVGGGWQETDSSDTTKRSVMDLGVGWSSGPLSLAAMYGQSNADGDGGDAEVTRYGVNGSYALGAGVDVQAQIDFGENDAAGPKNTATDYDWVQFMIGTSVSF